MANKINYTANYIAVTGKTILAAGRNKLGVARKATAKAGGKEVRVLFAAKALVDRYEETGRSVRFTIARNGRANLANARA